MDDITIFLRLIGSEPCLTRETYYRCVVRHVYVWRRPVVQQIAVIQDRERMYSNEWLRKHIL